jgi:hypothetical protein
VIFQGKLPDAQPLQAVHKAQETGS